MERTPPQKTTSNSGMDTDQSPIDQGCKIIVSVANLYKKLGKLTIADPNTAPGEYLFPERPEDHLGADDPDGSMSPRTPTSAEKLEILNSQSIDLDNVRSLLPGGSIPDRRPYDSLCPRKGE